MPEAITNTSPMLYLYRIGVLEWLPQLCDDIWIPQAVVEHLAPCGRTFDRRWAL
jgi:hypothetical protein